MSHNGHIIAQGYSTGQIIGWKEAIQPGLVKSAWYLLKGNFRHNEPLFLQYDKYKGKKMFLYWAVRKLLGRDIENVNQEIGDCVSWGARNGTEYTSCCDIFLRKEREKYRPVFPPYYYGTGRVYVGGWDNDYSDGSLGSYMATAVMKYGTLFSDEEGVPKYSGKIAKEFGAKRTTLDIWKPKAINYPIKSAYKINSWEELVVAICNGYACPTASNVGYNMEPSSDGFHRQTDSWAHQMSFVGVDDNDKDPYALLRNSWGDAHGHLKDFETGEDLPIGYLRVRRKDVEKHIRAEETFAYSQFEGFPEQLLEKALFKLI